MDRGTQDLFFEKIISVLFVIAIFVPTYIVFNIGVNVSVRNIVCIIMLITIFYSVYTSNYTGKKLISFIMKSRTGMYIYAIMILEMFVADILGGSPKQSINLTIKYALYSAFIFAGMAAANNNKVFYSIIKIILISYILFLFLCAIEFISNQYIIKTIGLDVIIDYMPDAAKKWATSQFASNFRNGVLRTKIIFCHPIVYGQYMGAMAPILLYYADRVKKNRFSMYVLFIIISLLAVYFSGSRSSYVVLMASVFIYVFLNNISGFSKKIQFTAYTVLAIFLLIFAINMFSNISNILLFSNNKMDAMSNVYRYQMYLNAIEQISNAILFGYGDGNAVYKIGIWGGNGLTLDNYYLSCLLNFGFLGLFLLFSFLIYQYYRGMLLILSKSTSILIKQNIILCISISVSLMIGLFVLSIDDNMVYVFFSYGFIIMTVANVRNCNKYKKCIGNVPAS